MKSRHLLALLLILGLEGCGGPPPVLTPKTAHGGMILDIQDSKDQLEIVRKSTAGDPGSCRLILYFLDAELKPLTTAPTAATLKTRGRDVLTIEFKPTSEAGALESTDLPAQGDIVGDLTATIDGKPVVVPINVR